MRRRTTNDDLRLRRQRASNDLRTSLLESYSDDSNLFDFDQNRHSMRRFDLDRVDREIPSSLPSSFLRDSDNSMETLREHQRNNDAANLFIFDLDHIDSPRPQSPQIQDHYKNGE